MDRHYGMDWLRIGAFGLLIFYHIGMVFVPWDFHVKTAHPIDAVAVPMQAINAWRLSLLFVVSGYASRAIFTLDPRAGTFAWARTLRLIVPLVAGIIVVVPLQPWVELSIKHGYGESFLHFWLHDYFRFGTLAGIVLPTWQHLWFVVYLWVYTAILALLLAILPASACRWIARIADLALAGPLLLIVPIALLLLQFWWIFPGAPETHALVDDLPIHRIYLAMFLFGFHLRASETVWAGIRRWWRVAAVLAVAGYATVAGIEIAYPAAAQPPKWIWAAFGTGRAVQCWGAIIALIGIADRWWNHDHRWRATLNEGVFPFYIIHQTIIVGVMGAILAFGFHPALEFAILMATTVAGCWAFYLIGREIGWLRPLIGLRQRRPIKVATV